MKIVWDMCRWHGGKGLKEMPEDCYEKDQILGIWETLDRVLGDQWTLLVTQSLDTVPEEVEWPCVAITLSDEGNNNQTLIRSPKVVAQYKNYPGQGAEAKDEGLPLGCAAGIDKLVRKHYKRIEDRRIKLLFLGQKSNYTGSRQIHLAKWKKATEGIPGILFMEQDSFGGKVPKEKYAQLLCDAQFVLCPPGHNMETFRMFEAAAAGCIPIPTIPLGYGAWWYYTSLDAGLVSIGDPSIWTSRSYEEKELRELSVEWMKWYEYYIHPEAVGAKILTDLRAWNLI